MHISDGILSATTCAAGYVAAGGLVAFGLRRAGQADSARAGILTGAFFLAGLVRFPLPGTSVHLLLASLNGIALGSLCFPSIFLALLLQALLLGHGGISTLGVNTVIMAVPAYLAGVVFHQGIKRGWGGWLLFFAVSLGVMVSGAKLSADALLAAGLVSFHLSWPGAALAGSLIAGVISLFFRFVKKPEPFQRWGFSTGALAVFLSALFFYLVLSFAPLAAHAAREGFVELARVAFLFHVPVIAVEGIVVALLVKYLDTVAPELLRVEKPAAAMAVAALCAAFFAPGAVQAHAVGADAYAKDGTIQVEAWLGGGEPPSSGRVTVLKPDGSTAAKGELDKGKWSFQPDSPKAFKFVVDLGHGHGKTFVLHPSEFKKLKESFAEDKEAGKNGSKPGHAANKATSAVKDQRPSRESQPHSSDTWLKALAGILVIGLLSAFLMIRNLRREVDELKKRLDKNA